MSMRNTIGYQASRGNENIGPFAMNQPTCVTDDKGILGNPQSRTGGSFQLLEMFVIIEMYIVTIGNHDCPVF